MSGVRCGRDPIGQFELSAGVETAQPVGLEGLVNSLILPTLVERFLAEFATRPDEHCRTV
jgi:hypothetical protein